MHRSLEFGHTDDYYYFGIQPPIEDTLKQCIREALRPEIVNEAEKSGFNLSTTRSGSESPYSEIGLTKTFLENRGLTAEGIVWQITESLIAAGDSVDVNTEPKSMGAGHLLFTRNS
jgi:hypothetical protein